MIDIHTHILPNVDDGSGSWEESLALIKKARNDGVKGLVCTSHIYDVLNQEIESDWIRKFQELKRRVQQEQIEIALWLGAEIHCNAKFDTRSRLFTLNGNGKYTLMELPLQEFPINAEETLFQLSIKDYVPILAHPERNGSIIQKPSIAYEMVMRGILLQVNAGSITGVFGKRIRRLALDFIDRDLAHFVASDCHNTGRRSIYLKEAYKKVKKRWGTEKADLLFKLNPLRAVQGKSIPVASPISFEKKRKNRLIGLLS